MTRILKYFDHSYGMIECTSLEGRTNVKSQLWISVKSSCLLYRRKGKCFLVFKIFIFRTTISACSLYWNFIAKVYDKWRYKGTLIFHQEILSWFEKPKKKPENILVDYDYNGGIVSNFKCYLADWGFDHCSCQVWVFLHASKSIWISYILLMQDNKRYK